MNRRWTLVVNLVLAAILIRILWPPSIEAPAPPPPVPSRSLDSEQHEPHRPPPATERETRKSRLKPTTVLLMGVDERKNDRGRPDALLVARLYPAERQIVLLSIPRDTYLPIAGKGKWDKVNHAYNYGIPTLIQTVEEWLEIPIEHYIWINMEGFVQLVDALGGVEVEVPKKIHVDHPVTLHLEPGRQLLTGEEALAYVRFRHDADNDFGRQRRQQQVLQALGSKVDHWREWHNVLKMLRILGDHVKTDFSFWELVQWASVYRQMQAEDIGHLYFQTVPARMKGIWYETVSEEERVRLANELKNYNNKVS